jgi:hypothetical protein
LNLRPSGYEFTDSLKLDFRRLYILDF